MKNIPTLPGAPLLVALTLALTMAPADSLRADLSRQIAQAGPATSGSQPLVGRRALVQQVQRLLIAQGFDPGPADGVTGERTTRSVQAFQRREGLNADGRISNGLLAALQRADRRARQPASPPAVPVIQVETAPAARPAAPAVSPRSAGIADSAWTLIDSRHARTKMRLLRDGKIEGVGNPAHWTWQYQNGEVLISYDNKMGGWVKRRGRLTGGTELNGEATSSRGRKWAWRAVRITVSK